MSPLVGSLHWRHNDHDGVSNHQPHGCLLNRLFRRRSKKTTKLRVTGLCVGNSPGPVNSLHKGPVTQKVFPFDDVIMWWIVTVSLADLVSYLKPRISLSLTHQPRGDVALFSKCHFRTLWSEWRMEQFEWNCPQEIANGRHWWWVNTGSGNGLMQSGNKLSQRSHWSISPKIS